MASFFEKLKKNLGIEIPVEEETTKKPEEKIIEKPKKVSKLTKPPKLEIGIKPIKLEVEKKEEPEKKEKWLESEGELAVDVYQTDSELVIQSAIAGIKPGDLDISVESDVILIKGKREKLGLEEKERNYFYQECYWGPFSRQIILPTEIDPSRIEASMKEGILTIRMPKIEREKKRKIVIKE